MRIDSLMADMEGLIGPPYNYDSWNEPYWWIRQYGGNCATTISASSAKEGGPYFGGTVAIAWNYLVSWGPYNRDAAYPRGTVIVTDHFSEDGEDFSHVGLIYARDQRFIHCRGPQGTHGVQIDASPEVSNTEWFRFWTGWQGYLWAGFFAWYGADFDPSYFDTDGNTGDWWAHPHLLAIWMNTVAGNRNIPGVLPVMASMANCWNDVWSPPGWGDLRTLSVYAPIENNNRIGFFRRRPGQSWGTAAQLMDPNYALDAFVRAALRAKPDPVPTDAAGLARWAQQVLGAPLQYSYQSCYSAAMDYISKGRALIPYQYLPASARPITDTIRSGLAVATLPESIHISGVGVEPREFNVATLGGRGAYGGRQDDESSYPQ